MRAEKSTQRQVRVENEDRGELGLSKQRLISTLEQSTLAPGAAGGSDRWPQMDW